MPKTATKARKPRAPKPPPRTVRHKGQRVELDRVTDTEGQIALIDQMVAAIGDRDVQGIARLLSTRRGLVEDLHRAIEVRRQAESGGTASQLEAKLVEALAAIDGERLARVIRGAARARGIDDVGEWLQAAESAAS